MGGSTISTSETRIEALVLPSSAYGVCIPLVGGVARVPSNLIDYFHFQSHAHTQSEGGKGGVETKNTSYTYSVSTLMGVMSGRGYIGRIWKGKQLYEGGWAPADVLRQADTYTVPGSGAMTKTLTHGATAIGAPFVTYTGPNWVQVLSEGTDYRVAGGVMTVLKDEWRGKTLNLPYQYGSGTYSHGGMTALGISAATGDETQSVPAWITADNPTHALNYPGLLYVHAQDYDLGGSASIEPHSCEVMGFGAYRYNALKPDCNIAEFVAWVLSNSLLGAGLPSGTLEVQAWIDYCAAAGFLMSPALTTQMRAGDLLQRACELTNSRVVQAYDRIRVLPLCDEPVTGNGVTFTPDTTPRYDLTDDFWVGKVPFNRTLKLPEDRFNHVKVEYNDRSNYYNKGIAESQDDGDIALNGRRTKPTLSAPWICDAGVARLVGQIVMQRELNIAGGGTCRLPWAFVLLDVGDLVTVTDPILGDDPWPMRITQLDEDEFGFLNATLEDWPLGTASPTQYTTEVPGGFQHDYNASPGSVDAPAIFEGPAELAGTTGIEVYVGARGANANYGGCDVWVSYDGTDYKRMGTIYGNSRYGTLQNSVTSGSTTFRITGLASAELNPGSADDATNLETLCYVGGANIEFFAHQGSTLISAGTYDLSGLVRGAYGSVAASHAAAVPFARLDERCARSDPLAASLVGQTIYIKCLAFNIYGRGQQTLADATAYAYSVTGIPAGYKPGVGGKGVDLKASALVFHYTNTGSVSPSSITLTALRKGTLSGTVTFSVIAGTATLTGTGDTRTLTPANLTTTTATIRASVTDGVGVYVSDVTISKVVDGDDGSDSSLLTLQCTRQQFTYDKSGNANPSSQTVSATALLKNLTGTASFTCTIYNASNTSLGTVTMGGSGNTRTLTNTQFVSLGSTAHYAIISASLSGETDFETVVKLQDGAENVSSDLDNAAVTLPADSGGVVSDYSAAVTRMKVWIGLTDDSTAWTYSRTNSTGTTSALGTGANENLLTISAVTSGVDAGYVDLTATRSGFPTQTKRFTWSKSKSAAGTTDFIQSFRVLSSDTEVEPTTQDAVSSITIETDGGISYKVDDATLTDKNYWFPNDAGIGADLWVLVQLAGSDAADVTGPAEGVRHALTTARTWELRLDDPTVGIKVATGYLTFFDAATGGSVVGTGTFVLVANRES